MVVADRTYFTGNYSLYFSIFQYASNRFREITESYGVRQVYMSYLQNRDPINLNDLVFEQLTLLILPTTIIGYPLLHENANVITFKGERIKIYQPLQVFPNEEPQRITYNSHILGDYYKERNLIIMYYNPFINPPRIRKYQNNLFLLFNNIPGLKSTNNANLVKQAAERKKYDTFSKNLRDNSIRFQNDTQEQYKFISRCSKDIINSEKKIQTNAAAVEAINRLLENFETEFEVKIEELKTLPFLNEVKVMANYISLDYDDIYITHGQKKYYIGKIEAQIYCDKIRFNNKNNKSKDGYHHPHVRPNGEACFGSFNVDISRMLGQLDFRKLAILLRQMLSSFNPNSPLTGVTHWKGEILSHNIKREITPPSDDAIAHLAEAFQAGEGLTLEQYNMLPADMKRQYLQNKQRRRMEENIRTR